jgi:hypothetical protein
MDTEVFDELAAFIFRFLAYLETGEDKLQKYIHTKLHGILYKI